MTETRVVGIDVAAARPCTCVLVSGREVLDWLDAKDPAEIRAWILRHWPQAVAVDAPCCTSKGLLIKSGSSRKPYEGRVCDRELRRRGIPLYEVPRDRSDASSWMEVGFQIYDNLAALGYGLPGKTGVVHSMIEVFPHASFVTLLDGVPAKKMTDLGRRQRMEAIASHGIRCSDRVDHDSLDALVAALTAARYLEGQASSVGEPREALVWLPVNHLRESYSLLSGAKIRLDGFELQHLHSLLLPQEREELLHCLLDAAPRGGDAMVEILDQWLLCCVPDTAKRG